jgi:ankyrin repeat protein
MYAAHHDHTAAVLVLLQFVASVEIQNQEGRTALMLAATEGYTAVVQALLQMNPDVSLTDNVSGILAFCCYRDLRSRSRSRSDAIKFAVAPLP